MSGISGCARPQRRCSVFLSSRLGSNNKFLLGNSVVHNLTDPLSIHTMTLWFMGQEGIFDQQQNPGQGLLSGERSLLFSQPIRHGFASCLREEKSRRESVSSSTDRPTASYLSVFLAVVCRRLNYVCSRASLAPRFNERIHTPVWSVCRRPRAVPFPLCRLFTTFDFWRRNELVLPSN